MDCVVTEDSDLVVYGSKRVLYKLDKYGCGQLILQSNLGAVQNPSLINFGKDQFLHMCVLAGCDFLPSINGLGVKKAHGLIYEHRTMDKVFKVGAPGRGHQRAASSSWPSAPRRSHFPTPSALRQLGSGLGARIAGNVLLGGCGCGCGMGGGICLDPFSQNDGGRHCLNIWLCV